MALTEQQMESVQDTIRNSLRKKFKGKKKKPAVMPFHTRLLGRDRLALYSFIHSLNTSFGTTIFEPVAASLASGQFKVYKQSKSGKSITSEAQNEIQKIMNQLTATQSTPDKHEEIEAIRVVCKKGEVRTVKPTKVDVHLEHLKTGEVYLIDIKTAKPNMGSFKEYKRTLLEWTATFLFDHPDAKIHTLIAIPYNPDAPKPYSRWTMAGMLDMKAELKVAEDFWDFLGGAGAYDDLLNCFEKVGVEMRGEIDDYFANFQTDKNR